MNANDVRLWWIAVANVGHVLDVDGRVPNGSDRQIVQFLNCLRSPIHVHLVFVRANLGGPGGKNQVLNINGIHDVERRQAFRLQSGRIQVNLDLALLAAVRIRNGNSINRDEANTQKIQANVAQLLFAQALAGKGKLQNRD